MTKNEQVKTPSAEMASAYVHQGIHGTGGWREAAGGLRHKTIPSLLGSWQSITLGSVLALFAKFLMFSVAVLFPILLRKVTAAPSAAQTSTAPPTFMDGVDVVIRTILNANALDSVLGACALLIFGIPKLVEILSPKRKTEEHSPFNDLTAAIHQLPIKTPLKDKDVDAAIRLTLSALREEMSLLVGSATQQRVTDVTLLQFCDKDGKNMKVRSRTANHEQVNRPFESRRFVAFYVAQEGRNFAEHDFKNKRNPFPAKRVTVGRGVDVDYRSVLYMPIVCSEQIRPAREAEGPPQVVDSCVGVICVHSSKPYRFWRWGDHKKGAGGFADVAFARAMPYIALLEKLMGDPCPRIKLEAK